MRRSIRWLISFVPFVLAAIVETIWHVPLWPTFLLGCCIGLSMLIGDVMSATDMRDGPDGP